MIHRQRLRNVGILCCHFLRNLAFYRSGWTEVGQVFHGQFWINVNSNFLDISILEWCKLFADKKGKHHWCKVISDKDAYYSSLLNAVGMSGMSFDDYIKDMQTYRDKFVAHLDGEPRMNIPSLEIAKLSVFYLYDYLVENEEQDGCFHDAPLNAQDFYNKWETLGHQSYPRKIDPNMLTSFSRDVV